MAPPLTKAEVNQQFYDTVGGEILFETEAQSYLHPLAVARLVAAYANSTGRRDLKILEIGANNCTFATSLLKIVTQLRVHNEASVGKIEYFAVEFARPSLEAALRDNTEAGFDEVVPGQPESPLVGKLTRGGPPQLVLNLVHAEAGEFVSGGIGRFDFVILNELLDDLPSRAFYSDAAGVKRELFAHAEPKPKWVVTVTATETEDEAAAVLPPATLTATSAASLAIVRGAAARLESGGMLLVHDYGFVKRYADIAEYEDLPKGLPEFLTVEFPDAGEDLFPRSFFRIFGSESRNVVQITTDVNFAELTEALEGSGMVITLPHGNAKLATREREDEDYVLKGDGIFLSEFATLGIGDDLHELLARLNDEQEALREAFVRDYAPGWTGLYSDLLFVKR